MLTRRTTLAQFLIEEQRRHEGSTGDFNLLVLDVALACKAISQRVARAALDGVPSVAPPDRANWSGGPAATDGVDWVAGNGRPAAQEDPVSVAEMANSLFLRATEWDGHLAGLVSEQHEAPYTIPDGYPCGKYLLLFNPLDGATNLDVDASVGSIFSILRAPDDAGEHADGVHAAPDHFLQPGVQQVAAGYAIYGPATMLVLTVGRGVNGFTLDPQIGEFILTHAGMTIPPASTEFAVNHSNRRFWEPAVRRYVDECLAGTGGPRGKDFTIRWVASLVAEAHRVLTRGGVFLYPRDVDGEDRGGHLRLLYEVNPVAFLVEQAGGGATTGRERVLEVVPNRLHQGVPFMFGARDEIGLLEDYHSEPDSGGGMDMPLYAARGLFRVF